MVPPPLEKLEEDIAFQLFTRTARHDLQILKGDQSSLTEFNQISSDTGCDAVMSGEYIEASMVTWRNEELKLNWQARVQYDLEPFEGKCKTLSG